MKTLAIILMLLSFNSFAETPDMEIQSHAENISEALEAVPTNHVWAWDLIRVRLMLQGGVDIPFITKFSLNPEIEFWFVKK